MIAETDSYIIATFALWAGDFKNFERLLREYSPPKTTSPRTHRAERPEDFIRATGALRLRQLKRRRSEFNALVEDYSEFGVEITDVPNILETTHLRATLWRTGEREFLMQGYLTDLGWQQNLFARARAQSTKIHSPIKLSKKQPTLEFLSEKPPRMSPGCVWVRDGNPFIQVELTDLGFIEATGLWSKQRLPNSGIEITKAFQSILDSLDETQPLKHSEHREKIE